MLTLIEPLHHERLEAFRALQVELTAAPDLAAVIVEEGGYPMLSVVRVDGARSVRVGCVYQSGAWYYATPDGVLTSTDDPYGAAASLARGLRA